MVDDGRHMDDVKEENKALRMQIAQVGTQSSSLFQRSSYTFVFFFFNGTLIFFIKWKQYHS